MDGPSYPVSLDDRASAETSAPTAADAAVLQVPEDASLKTSGELIRHPSAALYDDVFETLLPAIAELADRKKIQIVADDHAPLLHCALRGMSRRHMRRLLNGNTKAAAIVARAINHTLDEFMATRLTYAMLAMEGRREPIETVIAIARGALKEKAANDGAEAFRIWPDITDVITEHYARLVARERAAVTFSYSRVVRPGAPGTAPIETTEGA